MTNRLLTAIRQILAKSVNSGLYDSHLQKLVVTVVEPGRCVCELTVTDEHTNQGGSMHGGLTALLIDKVTTLALQANDNGVPGVSVDMNISYMSSAKPGDTIVIDASTKKYGRTLAFLQAELRDKGKGTIIASGTHTKFVGGSR